MSGLSLEALNDIGQRGTRMLIVLNDNEMSISPTVGAFSKYLSQIKLSSAWKHGKSAYDRTVERIPVVGGDGPRAEPAAAQVGRQLRPAGPALRGPGDHLHRGGPGPRPAGAPPDLRRRAPAARAGDRPRPDPEGPGLSPGRGRPGRLPWGGAAADDRRLRAARERRLEGGVVGPAGRGPPGADAHRVDGRRRRSGHPAPARCPGQDPELHGGLRGRAARDRPRRPAGRGDHRGDAHRHRPEQAPGRVPRPVLRCRDRRAARRWRWPPAWPWAASGRSSRSTRRFSSGPSTRWSTTSARTTSRS